MKLVSIETIPGQEFEALDIVRGTVVYSKNFGRDFMAGMKTLVGGEITGYTEMLVEARQIATKRMVDAAEALGADAVVGLRYASASVMQGAAEVKRHFPGQVYGTVIPRNVRLSEAPSFGKPVSAYDALSRGAEAYDALAQELLEHNQYAVTRVERKD